MTPIFYKSLLYCYILTGAFFAKPIAKTSFHPLHVSTADISYNKQEGNLEVICTIFTDDFENALAKQHNAKTDLIKPELHTAMDALVKQYIAANLHLKANGLAAPLNYVGFEVNREAVNIYLESAKIPLPKKVDAEVSLMHNLFNDQINIVHITVNGTRKSQKLEYPNKMVVQNF